MCGIVGYFNLNGSALGPDQATLESMCQTIHHRGPDERGMTTVGPAALGMTRLSIIDLATGQQPISNEDDSIWIVFNGEIYNFQELQKKVLAAGHKLKTHSDTETIIHLYEEYGIDCLQFLEGMFAFAIYDKNKDRLFIARDRMGEKPLHWGVFDSQLIFASELKAILAHPKSKKQLNSVALQKYLALEYVPAPLSMFEGIHKLMPAHYMLVEKGEVLTKRYWLGKPESEPTKISEAEAEDKLIELLDRSAKLRLISDVPLGIFLSGGIDSSAITALAARHVSSPLKTFSIGFADQSFDESSHAELVAKHVGCDHTTAIFSPQMALETLTDLWKVLDEPMADASILPTYFLSKMTKKSVTVALSGEGGDELFGGYPTYQAHRMAGIWQAIPGIVRKGILEPAINSLPVSHNNLSLDFKAKRFIASADSKDDVRHYRWMGCMSIDKQLNLLKPEFSPLQTLDKLYGGLTDSPLLNGNGKRDVVSKIMLIDQITYLPDDLLVKSDRASMAASLEVRLPFLAYPVVEFARQLPVSMKLKGLTTKYLLKKALKPYLPKSILTRPKKGFGIPTAKWLNNELKPVVDELFSETFVRQQGIFRYDQVKQLLDEHRSLKFDRRKELWTMMMFQWWWQKYFTNNLC